MTLTNEQLELLDRALALLNGVIADIANGVKTRETALALTHAETAELWLDNFIRTTPGVQQQITDYTTRKVNAANAQIG